MECLSELKTFPTEYNSTLSIHIKKPHKSGF
jgi:hypothetical protein